MTDEDPRMKELEDRVVALEGLVDRHHKALELVAALDISYLLMSMYATKEDTLKLSEQIPKHNKTVADFDRLLRGEDDGE